MTSSLPQPSPLPLSGPSASRSTLTSTSASSSTSALAQSVERLRPPITPIQEDSSEGFGANLCKSVESVDVTPGLDPNLCKSVESVDSIGNPAKSVDASRSVIRRLRRFRKISSGGPEGPTESVRICGTSRKYHPQITPITEDSSGCSRQDQPGVSSTDYTDYRRFLLVAQNARPNL